MLLSSTWCRSADVVFVRSAGGSSPEQQELEVATRFYGLHLRVVTAGETHNDDFTLSNAVERSETLAVVIAANILPHVNEKVLLRSLQKRPQGSVPLLILGLTPQTDSALLKTWSGGAAVGCRRLEGPLHLHYAIGRVEALTGQLTGLEIPYPREDTVYFVLTDHSEALEIAKVGDDHQTVPVFIEGTLNRQKVFLACTMPRASKGVEASEKSAVSAFVEIAPTMLFIKYCAGERGWHALYHYANFTIDDPWLREPYGFLDYKRLLMEMEKHDFHSTIAFIPWNYNRSDPEVVSLIRNHPERFSISIHGDDHAHKEFTDYGSRPLDAQVAAIRQSLSRMDRFQALTGIPYDKVMVFPHSIAPETTLEALKRYDYLATVNSQNVPMGSVRPAGLLFAMRSATLSFGAFPSIIRHSVAAPTPNYFIAINDFLDNPLLFYCHHQFFEGGMDAFDDVADRVNRLEPDTLWRGLGDIVRHLYLVKLRDDANYDVLAFSTIINLENTSSRDSVFYVRKMEVDHPPIASVVVDGQAQPFELRDGYLDFNLLIPAGQARSITIQYENRFSSPPLSIEEPSIRIYLLRMASDFRDNMLYRNTAGRALIHYYYIGEDSEPRPSHLLTPLLALMLPCICVGWSIRIFIRRRHRG
jgi:hypothetical protein